MADTYARMRQIVGSTADWAANNIVLGSGEIGIERVSGSDVRLKVGNGTDTWSALPYASASSTTINTATQTALDAKLAIVGGTMTGLLILSGDAVADLGAVTKQQLDDVEETLTTSISGKLSTSGGTLTGSLTLDAGPTSDLHAATKQYVDDAAAAKVDLGGGIMTGFLVLHADPSSAMHAVTKQYVDSGPYQTAVGGSATYGSKVVRTNSGGLIDSSFLPVTGSYRGAVDVTQAFALTLANYAVGDYLAVSVSGTIDSSWNTHITGSPTTAASGQYLIHNSVDDFDLVGDSTSSTAIDGKLDKTGGTMSGFIVLHADPDAAMKAATKQYVDARVAKAGDTMTGALTLSGAPSSGLHAATKTYVDTALDGKSNTGHGHVISDITNLQTTLDGKASSSHGHVIANVTGLQMALDGKAASSHTHAQSEITNLVTDLAAKAPLASPALTGTPTAPTAADTTDNTQIATTAFAQEMRRQIVQNAQTGTTYTPVATDAGKTVTLNNAAAITCTIDNSVFAAGDRVDFIQLGAGQVTFAAGAGFTLRSSGSKLKLAGQWSGATIYFLSASEGVLIGDIVT